MEEHIDSLYRVVHTAPPAACTQSLMLLFHLVVGSKLGEEQPEEPKTDTQNNRQDRFYRALYATLSKPALVSHGKHLTMYFNLLYKAMKYDTDIDRVNAFAKRIMCTILHSHSAPIAGSLFLLNEISKTHGGLRACIEEVPGESDANLILDDTKREPRAALVFWDKEDNDDNSRTRRPPSWELSLVSHHFHPSVAKFAKSMGSIEYAGDPLKDFGLAPFLDKFAYRNPKSRDKLASHYKRGQSIAERRAGTDGMMRARLELPMNDPSFLEREDVNEQDEFFRKFFVERARRDEIKGIIRGKKESLDDKERLEAEEGALDAAEEAEGMDNGKSVSSVSNMSIVFPRLVLNGFSLISCSFSLRSMSERGTPMKKKRRLWIHLRRNSWRTQPMEQRTSMMKILIWTVGETFILTMTKKATDEATKM